MTINLPRVAICLAAYNGSNWLSEQINSCLTQIGISVSIFISVDKSTDQTETLVDSFVANNSNIFTLPHNCYFGGASINFFRLISEIDFNDFDFIAFADQDDIWLPDKLQKACQIINSNQIDGYSGNVIAFWPNGKRKLINKSQKQQKWDYMFESAGPGCTFVLTKTLALDLQSFTSENQLAIKNIIMHDWFIYAFARSRGYKWFIDEIPYVLYRQHDTNVIGANIGIKAKLIRWRMLRDGWLINQAIIIAKILNYDKLPPMKKLLNYSISSRLYFITHISNLRRRIRDKLALSLYFFFLSTKTIKK